MANRRWNNGNCERLYFGGHNKCSITLFSSKIIAYGDCSHEIKRCLLLRRKAMTNLDSILKSRDITLPMNVHLVKAMIFPVVMYGCECWTLMKAEHRRIHACELWCWRRLLRVPWTARRSNQSILKEITPEYSLEELMLKLQYFGHLMRRTDSYEKKRPWCWERLKAGGKGDDRWHPLLYGHVFVQAPRFRDGWGNLSFFSPRGHKELDRTEWLKWTENAINLNISC